jgi:hypothetical protein
MSFMDELLAGVASGAKKASRKRRNASRTAGRGAAAGARRGRRRGTSAKTASEKVASGGRHTGRKKRNRQARKTSKRITRQVANTTGVQADPKLWIRRELGGGAMGMVPYLGSDMMLVDGRRAGGLTEPRSSIAGNDARRVLLHEIAHTQQNPDLPRGLSEALAEIWANRTGNRIGLPPRESEKFYPRQRKALRSRRSPEQIRRLLEDQFE